MSADVKEFFEKYEKANADSDISGIAAQYGDVFLFGNADGVRTVNKADFLRMVPKRKEYFAALGLGSSKVSHVEAVSLDAKYVMVRTSWIMTVAITERKKEIKTLATYILERRENSLTIVMQIDHQDLSAVVTRVRAELNAE